MDDQLGQTDPFWTALSERYRVERELGRGGMATVFLAQDVLHDRPVAIKVLKREVAAALGSARFLREIDIASRLTHPHLLPLHDSGEAAGFLYYVMPYVEGETLRARLKREKQLSLTEALRITCDVAEGLAFAHRHGVVHRDIKPENILLQADRAVVADFGIARAITASATEPLTTSGVVLGTALYMSPEQGCGERELDPRSDVYSLGCVLYEMLTGEPPFSGPSVQAVIARHASEHVPSIRVVRPNIPEDVEDVIGKALAKVPADRFPSADAFAQSLRACVVGGGRRRRIRRRTRRGVALVGASALVAVGMAFAARSALRDPLREHDWMVVADFESPPDDPRVGAVVRDLVTHEFQQSRFVRVVDRRQLNEVMRHAGVPETTHVDAERARELAVRSSVRAILSGSIRRLTARAYEVVLHVVSAEGGASLASAVATAAEETLPDTVQELVRNLRARLGERRSTITANRPLRDVATPSFEAFRYYSAALDRVVMRGDFAGSNELLAKAIALDSGFASAWALLGANYVTERKLDSARIAYARASALPYRLSPAQRYRLQGDAAYALDHDMKAAVRWYDLYLAEVPHSMTGRSNRAVYLSALGRYEEALADLKSGVAVNPFGAQLAQFTLLNLAAVLVVLGRTDEATTVTDSLFGPLAQYAKIMIAIAKSQWAAAESLAVAAAKEPSAQVVRIHALTSHAGALAARGAVRAADSVLRVAAEGSRGSTARWYERARLLLAIANGQGVTPRPDLVVRDTTVAARMLRSLWAAVAGDTAAARSGLTALGRLSTRERAVVGTGPVLAEGWIAARGGQWRRTLDLLGRVALDGEHDPIILDRPDSFLLRWLVAMAYEQTGKLDSAAVYLDLILRPTGMPPGHYALRGLSFGFAHHRLAELGERLGDRKAALRHLDAFLATFVNADGTTEPLVAEARKARVRLAGGVGTRSDERTSSSSSRSRLPVITSVMVSHLQEARP